MLSNLKNSLQQNNEISRSRSQESFEIIFEQMLKADSSFLSPADLGIFKRNYQASNVTNQFPTKTIKRFPQFGRTSVSR